MRFKKFVPEDYEALCDFLIGLNASDKNHINWNWARFEWMYEHPEFDKSKVNSIGLWTDEERITGAAIYDMYFGEGFCGALPGYGYLYPDIIEYAVRELSDDSGFCFAVCDGDRELADFAVGSGFEKTDRCENMMKIRLDREYHSPLPAGFSLASLDPVKEAYDFMWLLWQGFDHGNDRGEFERENGAPPELTEFRRHFNPDLSVTAVGGGGEKTSYCCLWYDKRTDYAYVEPVCTVPDYRGKGISKAVICEALERARKLGAKEAYVISDMDFYSKLGFENAERFSFYRKK